MSNYGLAQEAPRDGHMGKNVVVGEGQPLYSGQSLGRVKPMAMMIG
jgi:hypothetical protein